MQFRRKVNHSISICKETQYIFSFFPLFALPLHRHNRTSLLKAHHRKHNIIQYVQDEENLRYNGHAVAVPLWTYTG